MQDEMIQIGSILRAARDARGITQLALAQATGTAERTIMDIENDKRIPKTENLYKIINVLDLPSDHIFRPDKVCYTLEMEQVMQFIQSRDEEDQAVFMKIAWAYIEALVEKDAKKQTAIRPPELRKHLMRLSAWLITLCRLSLFHCSFGLAVWPCQNQTHR